MFQNWKIVRVDSTNSFRLYDLTNDPGEREDLSASVRHADAFEDMKTRLNAYLDAARKVERAWEMEADEETIRESVKKTHRLVIYHEEVKFAGSGAEIAAMVAEKAFDYLDAPILRVAAPFCPVPFAPSLEEQFIPSEEKIIEGVKTVMQG